MSGEATIMSQRSGLRKPMDPLWRTAREVRAESWTTPIRACSRGELKDAGAFSDLGARSTVPARTL